MDLPADLAENWTEFKKKTCSILATQMPACSEMEARHDQNVCSMSVNPSAKWLQTTILKMDAPLGGTRTQLIQGCGTLRRTIAPVIESHKIICILQHV